MMRCDSESPEIIRIRLREKANVLKPKGDFFIKSLRGDKENYYHLFINELINPVENKFSKRKGLKRDFTVTGSSIFKRKIDIESIYPLKQPMYTTSEKSGYTNFQSTSLALSDFYPPLFGHDKRDVLVGILIDEKDILLSDRLYLYDGGTINRPYDFNTGNLAEEYFTRKSGTVLFGKNQLAEFKQAIRDNANKGQINEALVRLHWNCDGSSKLFIANDNLESRLLVKQYADSLLAQLQKSGKCPLDYQVPICFYIPENPELIFKEYTNEEYNLDCIVAQALFSDKKLRNNKYTNHQYEFLFGLETDEIHRLVSQVNYQASCKYGNTWIDLPIFLELLYQGHVHIFRFIMEKSNLALQEILSDVLSHFKDDHELITTVFYHALRCRYHELAEFIWEHVDFINFKMPFCHMENSPFHVAVEKNLFSWVERLLKCNFDIKKDGYPALNEAATNGRIDIFNLLLKHCGDLNDALRWSVADGSTEMVSLLIAKGVDVNILDESRGYTMLGCALNKGMTDKVKILLDTGADITKKGNKISMTYNSYPEYSTLQLAVLCCPSAVELLIKHGADVNEKTLNVQNSPFIQAIYSGNINTVKLLLKAGADIYQIWDNGITVLYESKLDKPMITFLDGVIRAISIKQQAIELETEDETPISIKLANLFYCYSQSSDIKDNFFPIFVKSQSGSAAHDERIANIANTLYEHPEWEPDTCNTYISEEISMLRSAYFPLFNGVFLEAEVMISKSSINTSVAVKRLAL